MKSDATTVDGMARAALLRGGQQVTPRLTEWCLAPWCSSPWLREHHYRQEKRPDGTYRAGRQVLLRVACRACAGCLAQRQRLWFARVVQELGDSHASFLVTLTLAPEARYQIEALASRTVAKTGSGEVTFSDRARELVPFVQRYIKRCRKGRAPLRYMFVIEPHRDGVPHVHILWHMSDYAHRYAYDKEGYPDFLRSKWSHGFTSMKRQVERNDRAAGYVAKYLNKEAGLCLRASVNYGSPRRRLADVALASATETEGDGVEALLEAEVPSRDVMSDCATDKEQKNESGTKVLSPDRKG